MKLLKNFQYQLTEDEKTKIPFSEARARVIDRIFEKYEKLINK